MHGLYKSQLADSAGDITLSFDPIVVAGKVIGWCFLATLPGQGAAEIDSVYIAGDCGVA